ncbi:hypothetical protein [Deinococcus humi]|uniref:Uncharacterized protein n=1 Tax=Deinococcus humi TaxID=662880 RepID=A0A7W8K0E1_9DEIO|nr:hypothetical protein [Deinococcus humi]MBB5366340.1 hypothetical protein [Deinococcus humi]GGO41342.1 hypothetical protein GCM10008949_52070 [Deinococcus humi]
MTQKKTPRIDTKTVALAAPQTAKQAKKQITTLLRKNAEAMKALA